MIKVLEYIIGVEERLHDMIFTFNQENNTLKEDLGTWDQMEKGDLDVLITYDIFPSLDIYYEYQGLVGHKAQLMENILTKIKRAQERFQAIEMEIMGDLR